MLRASGALTVEEVRHLAAERVQAWWKGTLTAYNKDQLVLM